MMKSTARVLALFAAIAVLAGCVSAGADGRYATHDGGRGNNRVDNVSPAHDVVALR